MYYHRGWGEGMIIFEIFMGVLDQLKHLKCGSESNADKERMYQLWLCLRTLYEIFKSYLDIYLQIFLFSIQKYNYNNQCSINQLTPDTNEVKILGPHEHS